MRLVIPHKECPLRRVGARMQPVSQAASSNAFQHSPKRASRATAPDLAQELTAIVEHVRRLQPSWQQPERFHEAKSEVVARLRALVQSPHVVRTVLRFVPVITSPPTQSQTPRPTGARRCRKHSYPRPPPASTPLLPFKRLP